MLSLTPTEKVRYTEMRAMEQGERKVVIPRKSKPRDSSSNFTSGP
jgi:hypothetical protein